MPALMNGVIHFESGHDSVKAAAKGVVSIWRAVFMLADICLILPLHEPWVNILMNRNSTPLPGGGLGLSDDEIKKYGHI